MSIDGPTARDQEVLRRTFFHFQEQHIEISWPHTFDFGGERHFLIVRCMPEDAERLKIEATQFFQAEYESMKKAQEGGRS
ncbi:MAG: hypothetical protein WC663_06280 [Patescibacteria group bacterium]